MATIKVLAGDFQEGKGHSSFGFLNLKAPGAFLSERIKLSELESVEIASEESVKKIGGTLGWGAAGGMILGPVGLLAGLLLGGRNNEVTFVARFKDGRKLLATTDSATFKKLQAAAFS